MKLPNPVTVIIPGSDDPQTVTDVSIVITDNCDKRFVTAHLLPFRRPIVLWTKDEYDKIGDYTQAQVENRILEILGDKAQVLLRDFRPQLLKYQNISNN